jgi:hypothetical protein
METKDAGIGAAVAVLLAILGLIIIVGVILLMMWKQPGIEHSPSQQSSLRSRDAAPELSFEAPILRRGGEQLIQGCGLFRSEA